MYGFHRLNPLLYFRKGQPMVQSFIAPPPNPRLEVKAHLTPGSKQKLETLVSMTDAINESEVIKNAINYYFEYCNNKRLEADKSQTGITKTGMNNEH